MSVRNRIGIGIGMCAMVSLLGGQTVSAADDAESIWKTLGFQSLRSCGSILYAEFQ